MRETVWCINLLGWLPLVESNLPAHKQSCDHRGLECENLCIFRIGKNAILMNK